MNLSSILELFGIRAQAVAIFDSTGTQVDSFNSTVTFPDPPPTAVLSTLAYSASSQVALAANVNRRRFLIANPTSKTVNVAFAATASLSSYSVLVPQNGVYESPLNDYTGVVSVFWQSAPSAGPTLHITEITT